MNEAKLLHALKVARDALEEAADMIDPERGNCEEMESEIAEAIKLANQIINQ
jgi:hypothetical protein